MPIALLMDVHIKSAFTDGLRQRGVDVVTAQEDGSDRLEDSDLLDRAAQLNRVLFTNDDDLLAEATRRQRSGASFCGLVYAHQVRVSVGVCIRDLEIIAKAGELEDMQDQVRYLPL